MYVIYDPNDNKKPWKTRSGWVTNLKNVRPYVTKIGAERAADVYIHMQVLTLEEAVCVDMLRRL